MDILANYSIRRKLTLIIMLTSAAALFLAGVAFLAYELITFRSAMVQNVSTLAAVIGNNSTAALIFSEPKTAEEALAALTAEPHIVAAQIYKKDSTTAFASYIRPGPNPPAAGLGLLHDDQIFQGDYLFLRRPIVLNQERIGDIFLQSDLLAMSARFKRYAVIVVLVLVVSMTIAYFLSSFLQQVISKPIFHLVQTARIVSQRKDYSVRASKLGQDELGLLVDSFNDMLAQIHRQDETLRETNKALTKLSRDNQLVLDSAGDGICGMDLQGNATFVNPAAGKILNAAPDELTGRPLHEWLQPQNGAAHGAPQNMKAHPFYDVLRDGKVHHSDGEIFRRRDGTSFPLDFTYNPIRDETDALVGAVVTFKDITERKRAEEQIKASLHEKEILLKEIHHRVKNNLQVITSLLNLQSSAITQPEVLAMFMESQSRIRSMALIHEKLYQSEDLAKIDFAEYVESLTNYLFRTYVVNSSLIRLHVQIENVSLDVDAALPCGLMINELVSNSIKYAFPGERKGEINIRLFRREDDRLVLSVKDNGVGLPDEVDIKNSKSLGLKLVNILTKQLGGELDYTRTGGTEYKVVFRAK